MKKKDRILVLSILLLAGLLWLAPRTLGWLGHRENLLLKVTVEGRLYGEYSLEKDQIIEIHQTNICEIKDKQVRMTLAECPDKLCMHQGPIHMQGETIVCLPNKVVLEISAPKEGSKDQIDTIVN